MTNYPSGPPIWAIPLPLLWPILVMTFQVMTFNPRTWATTHTTAWDLPSAWWVACRYHGI